MKAAESGYVQLDDGKVYYEMQGEGDDLVFVHAGFADSRMWFAQWAFFSQHYRVTRYDLLGFGQSDPLQAPVSRSGELYQLLKHLNVERATLIGCSLGGAAIIDFALEHPEMVTALAPVSAVPSGFQMQGEPPAELLEMFGAIQQGKLRQASDLQVRLWADGPFRQPEQVDPQFRELAAAMTRIPLANGTWAIEMSQPERQPESTATGRLKEIQAPVLILAGALDNSELLRAADVMESEIPGAKKVIIPAAAHMPNMEKPEMFNQVVSDFLKEAVHS
jgi:pimeloyl-ACP methyl ester carboxylesterase